MAETSRTTHPPASANAAASQSLPGDAPPGSRRPLVLALAAWVLWLIFLLVMMILRMRATSL